MSEYIVDVGDADELHFAAFQKRAEFCFGYPVREEIVRYRDCEHYTADNELERYPYCAKCGYVKPDGFCAWGKRRGGE